MSKRSITIDENKEVVVDIDTYWEFRKDSEFLNCLVNCGVDNWEGYERAQEMMDD